MPAGTPTATDGAKALARFASRGLAALDAS